MKKGIWICIDGVDASGKTTTSEKLSDKLSFNYIKTPTNSFNSMRKFVDRNPKKIWDRYLFYISSVVEAAYFTNTYETNDFVFDRFLASTLSHHTAIAKMKGDYKLAEDLNKHFNMSLNGMYPPDIYCFLYLDKNKQKNRILSRSGSRSDSLLENDFELMEITLGEFESFFDKYRKHSFFQNTVFLKYNTGKLSTEEIVLSIEENLKLKVDNYGS